MVLDGKTAATARGVDKRVNVCVVVQQDRPVQRGTGHRPVIGIGGRPMVGRVAVWPTVKEAPEAGRSRVATGGRLPTTTVREAVAVAPSGSVTVKRTGNVVTPPAV